jgi:hypothetical protein
MEAAADSVTVEANRAVIKTLPPEILHHIFSWLNPDELDPVSRVCRFFYDFITGNQNLCRDIYLFHLVSAAPRLMRPCLSRHICSLIILQDSPPNNARLNWETELRDLVKLEQLFALADADAETQVGPLPDDLFGHIYAQYRDLTCSLAH